MEEKHHHQPAIGLVFLLSILVSLIAVFATLYIFRGPITDWLFAAMRDDVMALIPPAAEFRSDDALIREAIATVNPTVVSVVVTKDIPVYERYYETIAPWGLFGEVTIPRIRENGTEAREVGGGSGFIVSHDGLIVTNRHVVADEAARYSVILNDGTVYNARVVARDSQLDIAVIAIDEPLQGQLAVATFGDSRTLALGQTVIAIGNALAEFQNSVSVGVVSGLARSVVASDMAGNIERLDQVIQTDAAINPGNSGGPLISITGEVIGMNVAASQGADNIGFALPAELVEQVVTSVKETGEIIRPFLGVRYQMLTELEASERSLSVSYGALLVSGSENSLPAIEPNSPAELAGLQPNDVITEIDGESLRDKDLATLLRSKRAGQKVSLTVWRDGVIIMLTATLQASES